MKKIICDFCGKENEYMKKYVLPIQTEVCMYNNGIKVGTFRRYIEDEEKDVCPVCREKIALFLESLKVD